MRVAWQAGCCKTKVFFYNMFFIHTTVTTLKAIYISSFIYLVFSCSKRKIIKPDLLAQQSSHSHDSKVCQPSMRLLALHCKSRQLRNSYSFNDNHQCLFVVSQKQSYSASDSPSERRDSSSYHNKSVYALHRPATVPALMLTQWFVQKVSQSCCPCVILVGASCFSPFRAGARLIPTSESLVPGPLPESSGELEKKTGWVATVQSVN